MDYTASPLSSCFSTDTRKSAVLEHVRFQSLQSLLSEISQEYDVGLKEKHSINPAHDEESRGLGPNACSCGRRRPSTDGGQEEPGDSRAEHHNHSVALDETMQNSNEFHRLKSPKVLKKIQKLEKNAIALLDELGSPPTSKTMHHQSPTMPISAIRFSKYLVFLWQRKVGCLIAYEWRYGFILYQSAPGVWSEPVLVKHRYVSVGATCGWSCGKSVFAISDDAAMIDFIKQSSLEILPNTVSFDCRYSNDSVNAIMTCKSLGTHVTRYHIDSAASYIVDLSLKIGRESVDTNMHEAMYGSPAVSVRDILDGHVPLLSCCQNVMHGLYAYLGAKGIRSCSMARETKQLFQEERASIYNSMSLVQRRSSSCLTTKMIPSSTSSLDAYISPSVDRTSPSRQKSSLFGDSELLDLDLGDP